MSSPLELSFVTLDVFTTKRFQGNPLAIVRVPAGVDIPQETKQTVAREFNFSETVFLHENPGGREFPFDIFTITHELPFAGHPTIGTASYLLAEHDGGDETTKPTALLAKAGRIPIERAAGDAAEKSGTLVVRASVPHDVHVHAGHLREVRSLEAVRRSGALGHGSGVIEAAELDAPVVSIVRGMAFVLVRLPSLELLGQVCANGPVLDFGAIDDLLDKGPWNVGFVGRYYYVVTGKEGATTSIRTRMVNAREEDPATGSAACTLASYLTLQRKRVESAPATTSGSDSKLLRYDITQGVEMGRRSDILVEVQAKVDDGGAVEAIETVYLGGSAVEVTQGTIRV